MKWASLPTARGRKTILWIVLSMPLLWLAVLVIQELRLPNSGLGPEPTEALLHYLGEWSLISLLLAFSVSPLRRRLNWVWLGQHRRLIGLFAFAYVCLHVLVYAGLYAQFQLAELLDDPGYDDETDDDDNDDLADGGVGEDGRAGTASEGEDGETTPKRAKKTKGRKLGLLGGKTSADGALDATGIVKSSQTYSCPRWTANRDLTSITWSPHRREMLVASYQTSSSSSAAGGTGGASVDAAVRAVSPADTPSSSLIPQSSELRSDGLALVWNLALPDRPEHIFCCGSPVLTTAFHPTEVPLVIGGCHSGQVVVWDVRAGRLPVQRSVGPAGGGHAHPICSMEVVESGVSNKNVCGMWDAFFWLSLGLPFLIIALFIVLQFDSCQSLRS